MRKIILLLLGAALLGAAIMLAYNMLFPPRPPVSVSDPTEWRGGEPPQDVPVDMAEPDDLDPPPLADGDVVIRPPKPAGERGAPADPSDPAIAPAPVSEDDAAYAAKLCRGDLSDSSRSSLFGHRPSQQVGGGSLTGVPRGFGSGGCQQIHSSMAGALRRMLDAAKDAGLEGEITGVSCYRSVERQRQIFCNPARIASRGYAGQAFSVAPPGFSEHSTGFAIDFGSRSNPGCNLQECFATTRAGVWLLANAGTYGFQLSFPRGNSQGVTYEPWHYRWNGGG